MKLGTKVGLDPRHIVLDGIKLPLPKGAELPNFTNVCCGQTAGWIEMPLGMEVGLGSGDIVLDRDPAPPKRGTHPTFRSMPIVAKRWPISATAEHLYKRSPKKTVNFTEQ